MKYLYVFLILVCVVMFAVSVLATSIHQTDRFFFGTLSLICILGLAILLGKDTK